MFWLLCEVKLYFNRIISKLILTLVRKRSNEYKQWVPYIYSLHCCLILYQILINNFAYLLTHNPRGHPVILPWRLSWHEGGRGRSTGQHWRLYIWRRWKFHLTEISNDITLIIVSRIQVGSVSAPFTGTAYWAKYFKPIPKEINQDTSTVKT